MQQFFLKEQNLLLQRFTKNFDRIMSSSDNKYPYGALKLYDADTCETIPHGQVSSLLILKDR